MLGAADRVPYLLLHDGLLTPIFAALVLGLALGDGALARGLGAPAIVTLGEASYALYILHVPAWMAAHNAAGRLWGPTVADGPAFVALFLVALVAASVACFRFVEVPARRRIRAALES